jgi:uncharacterized repeat protein (TIGR04076 family)
MVSNSERVAVEVIKSSCELYKEGDKIFIDGPLVDKQRSANLCFMAIQSIFPFIYAFRKGVTSEQMGYGEKLIVQCPDYCGPVVFEIKKEEE